MNVVIWSLLIIIGVSDAQRHRIPNQYIGMLLLAVTIDLSLKQDVSWWFQAQGFLVTFALGFGLYLCRLMAGGDVKLLAVLGLWLGAETMWSVTPFIVVAGGVIGGFYLALYLASSSYSITEHARAYAVQKVSPGWKSKEPLVIPFAPAIVIGLAYYFYTH
ncbi:A24 family peptidase [Vibrio natriegens]|uniref:A24 family peptidase n=1 Tax=Vibrio natriegens TaxID=691 RepID=UPI000803EF37|nr:A24 family peptidase [Vibrio natriegens]ANQ17859.1 peptidase A24 [Vibrio natriegens]